MVSVQLTYTGYVATTNDALILFEACLSGRLYHVRRRPHGRERNSLICSGYVFIYEENISGIKRWDRWSDMEPKSSLTQFPRLSGVRQAFWAGPEEEGYQEVSTTPCSTRRTLRPAQC